MPGVNDEATLAGSEPLRVFFGHPPPHPEFILTFAQLLRNPFPGNGVLPVLDWNSLYMFFTE
jgi:hypothetical protein